MAGLIPGWWPWLPEFGAPPTTPWHQGAGLWPVGATSCQAKDCSLLLHELHVTTVSGLPNGWEFINLRLALVLKNIYELLYNNDLQLGSRHFGSHCSHLFTSDAGTQTATMTAFQSALISNCPHCTSPVVGSSSNTSSCPVRIKRSARAAVKPIEGCSGGYSCVGIVSQNCATFEHIWCVKVIAASGCYNVLQPSHTVTTGSWPQQKEKWRGRAIRAVGKVAWWSQVLGSATYYCRLPLLPVQACRGSWTSAQSQPAKTKVWKNDTSNYNQMPPKGQATYGICYPRSWNLQLL